MSACEICWCNAYAMHRMDPRLSQAQHYHALIEANPDRHPALVTDEQADAAHAKERGA